MTGARQGLQTAVAGRWTPRAAGGAADEEGVRGACGSRPLLH